MNKPLASLVLAGCAIGLLVGLVKLFNLRMEAGDIYPPYSSLRADPLGAMAFYESLERLPAVSIARDYRPVNELPAPRGTTYLHVGAEAADWELLPEELQNQIESFTSGGGRLVVTFSPQTSRPFTDRNDDTKNRPNPADRKKGKSKRGAERAQPSQNDPEHPGKKPPRKLLVDRSGLGLGFKALPPGEATAFEPVSVVRQTEQPLPETLQWHSGTIFTNLGPSWRTIYARGTNPVVIELPVGKGSLVMASDSYFLSNEALMKDRHSDLLTWLVGQNAHVVFDEAHLGIVEQEGVATLIRSYRLQWLAGSLVILAALFVWKSAASLLPHQTPEVRTPYVVGKESSAGFVNLLRRNLAARDLLGTCLAEWKREFAQPGAAGVAKATRAQAVLDEANARPPRQRNLLVTYRALCAVLGGPSTRHASPTGPVPASKPSSQTTT